MTLPHDMDKHASLPRQGTPVVLSPHDYKWLATDECFLATDITFEQLEGNDAWQRLASTIDLISAWHNPSLSAPADMPVLIHGRFVQPLLDLTLLFLGLPLILRRGNRNVFVAIGLCLGVVVGFLLVVTASQQLGSGYLLPPDVAVWIPLVIFVPVAVAISQPLRE
jgi:lipopolysaccharide export system permease protein